MPAWLDWFTEHWIPTALVIGLIVAIAYVFSNRNSLFTKE
jgi:hypothetical protein